MADFPQTDWSRYFDSGQNFGNQFTSIFNNMQRLRYQQAKDLIDQEMSQAQLDETERYHTGVLSHQKEQDAIGNRRADQQAWRDFFAGIAQGNRADQANRTEQDKNYLEMGKQGVDLRAAKESALGRKLTPEEMMNVLAQGGFNGQAPPVQGGLPSSTIPSNVPPEVAANIQGANQEAMPAEPNPQAPAMGQLLFPAAKEALAAREALAKQRDANTARMNSITAIRESQKELDKQVKQSLMVHRIAQNAYMKASTANTEAYRNGELQLRNVLATTSRLRVLMENQRDPTSRNMAVAQYNKNAQYYDETWKAQTKEVKELNDGVREAEEGLRHAKSIQDSYLGQYIGKPPDAPGTQPYVNWERKMQEISLAEANVRDFQSKIDERKKQLKDAEKELEKTSTARMSYINKVENGKTVPALEGFRPGMNQEEINKFLGIPMPPKIGGKLGPAPLSSSQFKMLDKTAQRNAPKTNPIPYKGKKLSEMTLEELQALKASLKK